MSMGCYLRQPRRHRLTRYAEPDRNAESNGDRFTNGKPDRDADPYAERDTD